MRAVVICVLIGSLAGCGREASHAPGTVVLGASADCDGKPVFLYTESGMFDKEVIALNPATGDVRLSNSTFPEAEADVRFDRGTALRAARALERLDWNGLAAASRIEDIIVDDSLWEVEICLQDRVAAYSGPGSSCDLPSCRDLQTIVGWIRSTAQFNQLEERFQ